MGQFKRAKVIMLPNNKGTIGLRTILNFLFLRDKEQLKFYKNENFQHLYITSDDEIKEGDYYYDGTDFIHRKSEFNDSLVDGNKNARKIIATTDTTLHVPFVTSVNENLDVYEYSILPQPSQQFIEKYIESYNKGVAITDVMVEYEDIFRLGKEEYITSYGAKGNYFTHDKKVKVDTNDNTITIENVKGSWSREEVIRLLKIRPSNLHRPVEDQRVLLDKWIEGNL